MVNESNPDKNRLNPTTKFNPLKTKPPIKTDNTFEKASPVGYENVSKHSMNPVQIMKNQQASVRGKRKNSTSAFIIRLVRVPSSKEGIFILLLSAFKPCHISKSSHEENLPANSYFF